MPPSYPWRVLFAPCAESSRAFCAFAVYQAISLLVLGPRAGRPARQRGRAVRRRPELLRVEPRLVARRRRASSATRCITDRIYAPEGFNLAWATVIPGPAFLAAPLTLLTSPIVSYNVLALIALPLNGLGAFLLCREVTAKTLPALVGGGVFAFSSYGLAESVNHLNLALVVCIPLAALVGVRHARGAHQRPPRGARAGRPGGGADADLHGGARHRRAVRARLPCAAAAVADGRRGDRRARAGRAGGGAVPVRRVRAPEPAPGGHRPAPLPDGPREPVDADADHGLRQCPRGRGTRPA